MVDFSVPLASVHFLILHFHKYKKNCLSDASGGTDPGTLNCRAHVRLTHLTHLGRGGSTLLQVARQSSSSTCVQEEEKTRLLMHISPLTSLE